MGLALAVTMGSSSLSVQRSCTTDDFVGIEELTMLLPPRHRQSSYETSFVTQGLRSTTWHTHKAPTMIPWTNSHRTVLLTNWCRLQRTRRWRVTGLRSKWKLQRQNACFSNLSCEAKWYVHHIFRRFRFSSKKISVATYNVEIIPTAFLCSAYIWLGMCLL